MSEVQGSWRRTNPRPFDPFQRLIGGLARPAGEQGADSVRPRVPQRSPSAAAAGNGRPDDTAEPHGKERDNCLSRDRRQRAEIGETGVHVREGNVRAW